LPEACHTKPMHVDVETHGDLTRGMSVIDRRTWQKTMPNANVVLEVDTKAVRQYINRVIGY
jgi:inosine-uridine nucleoside N-ribohydrolase